MAHNPSFEGVRPQPQMLYVFSMPGVGVPQQVRRTVAAVEDACRSAVDGDQLLQSVDLALRDVVPFDGATWFGTDPATLLSTAPARITGIEAGHCDSFWQREFLVEDAILFRDLSRASEPVASLRAVTGDRPIRSARYREFLAPQGFDDELRAVFRVGDSVWGLAALYRDKGRPAFSEKERDLVASVADVIGRALRGYVARSTPWQHTPSSPGLLLFGPDDSLISANPEADEWLGEMEGGSLLLSPAAQTRSWVDAGSAAATSGYPFSILVLVARARAITAGYESGPARMRMRGRSGQWLVLHASCMGSSHDGTVAVMIEPAKSGDVAPIIVEAYALSPRERDVVRAIARGLSSAEIAGELFLSPHTVRDYVKSVFEKVGVSSRGELVAKLFAEHYSDALHAAADHAR